MEPFLKPKRAKGRSAGTINRYITVERRIQNLAACYWRDAHTGLSWLETAPLFRVERGPCCKLYTISWEERRLLLPEPTPELARTVFVPDQHRAAGPGTLFIALELAAK